MKLKVRIPVRIMTAFNNNKKSIFQSRLAILHTIACINPHTTVYVSSYYYIYVLILLYMCPHAPICVRMLLCVLILLYMCHHTPIYMFAYYYICVRILLHKHLPYSFCAICMHIYIPICVSAYYYICVRILLLHKHLPYSFCALYMRHIATTLVIKHGLG